MAFTISATMLMQIAKASVCLITFGSFMAFVLIIQLSLKKFYSSSDPSIRRTGSTLSMWLSILPVSMIMPILGGITLFVSPTFSILSFILGVLLFLASTLGVGIWLLGLAGSPEYEEYKHIMKSAAAMIFIFYIMFFLFIGLALRFVLNMVKGLKLQIPWASIGKFCLCLLTLIWFIVYISTIRQNLDDFSKSENPDIRQAGTTLSAMISILPIAMIMPILGVLFLQISPVASIVMAVIGVILFLISTIITGSIMLSWGSKSEYASEESTLNTGGTMIILFYVFFVICMIVNYSQVKKLIEYAQSLSKSDSGHLTNMFTSGL
jgi:hypothetical protein